MAISIGVYVVTIIAVYKMSNELSTSFRMCFISCGLADLLLVTHGIIMQDYTFLDTTYDVSLV